MSQMPEDGSSPYGDLPYAMAGLKRRSTQYDRQRQMAYGMMQQSMDTSPIAHPMQGVSRLAQALVGSLMANRADEQEAAATKQRQDAWTQAASIADPQARLAAMGKIDPEMGARYAGQVAMQEIAAKRKAEENRGAADTFLAGFGGGGGQGGPQVAAMPPEQAKATGAQYVKYLVETHGFKPEEAAAMVGNLYQESGFNPTALHDNGTGFGMGGWRLDRRDALLNYAQQNKRDPRDPQTQLDFYATELKGRPEFAQFQAAQDPASRQAALMTYFRPAGWTPQAPQAGHGFGNRVQFGQTFMPGQGQPVAQDGGQGAMPTPQPPGAAPQMPRPTEIPKPQPDPQIMQQAYGLLQTGKITPVQAQQMVMDDVNRRWQIAVTETSADRRQAASDAAAAQRDVQRQAAEERKQNMPSQAEMAKFREAKSEGGRIIAALNDFRAEADKDSGWRSVMGATTPANTAYNTAALLAKGEALFNLGVLNGPDLDIIRRTLPDPSTVRGAFMTTPKEREAAVNKVIRVIEDGIARKERVLGLAPSAPQQEAPQQGQGGGGGGGGIVPPPDAVDAELRRRGLLK
jgi:soluble cytochrome b562